MRARQALMPTATCLCTLILLCLLSACSNTPQVGSDSDTLTAGASAMDEATARANAMAAGQQQCLARDDRHVSLVDMRVTPPAMATMDDGTSADATTDALEAATSEGDAWHATLTFHCR